MTAAETVPTQMECDDPSDAGGASTTSTSASASTSAETTTNTKEENTPKKPLTSPKVDRQWILKLLQKHSSDVRLAPYYKELHQKYPILKDKALVVAPMVDQSDLPFRLLCRNYGTNLCFTPMIHAKNFHNKPKYRENFWSYVNGTPPEDRPLIVQLCGSDKEHLLYTIRYIMETKGGVDGFDLNCGCPQTIAKRGMYGAFLLEKDGGDRIVDVVETLVKEVGHLIPISVKVRILPSGVEDSLKLYKRLVDAGASMLTIHGRNRLQKALKTGKADWDAIKKVVELFGDRIPILANGGIGNLDDVVECLRYTGVDGVMSSEAILEYPALFTDTNTEATGGKRCGPSRLQLAREYMKICESHPPEKGGQGQGIKCIRAHIHKFMHQDLDGRPQIRQKVALAKDAATLLECFNDIEAINKAEGHKVEEETLAWYMRYRIPRRSESNPQLKKKAKTNATEQNNIESQ